MSTMTLQKNLEFWKKSLAANWPLIMPDSLKKVPGHYDLVLCPVNDQGMPIVWTDSHGHSFVAAFTHEELIFRIMRSHTLTELSRSESKTGIIHGQTARQFMLGELVMRFQDAKKPTVIFLNPIKIVPHEEHEYIAEEIIFCPILDPVTKKLMTTTDEALALLAISHEDMARFGIEIVFHLITNSSAPEDRSSREAFLKAKIQELAFMAPRIPMKRGSGSVLCVMLNLDNKMEELAFIRRYKTLDNYADVIFVTSSLELLDGDMNTIPYDGNQIDTVFSPIIEWQRSQQSSVLRN